MDETSASGRGVNGGLGGFLGGLTSQVPNGISSITMQNGAFQI